jgi:hypothetical protein
VRPQDRIRKDRESVMRRVKEGAQGKARDRMRRAMKGKKGALEEMESSVDRDVETGFVEECDRLRRKYGLRAERCEECGGKKRCPKCSGEGGKQGLLGFSKCRECKGSGVCRGCLRQAQAVLDLMAAAERYAGMRGVSGGESPEEFQALLRRLGITIDEAAVLQQILNVALNKR